MGASSSSSSGFSLRRKKKALTVHVSADQNDVKDALSVGEKSLRDMEKRLIDIQTRIQDCVADAKKREANNDRMGALNALRRKHLFEEEAARVSAAMATLESQNITLEASKIQQTALSALSSGVAVHERLQVGMNADAVDMLMEKLDEQRQTQNEIHEMLTQGVAPLSQFEDELESLLTQEKSKEAELAKPPEAVEQPIRAPQETPIPDVTVVAVADETETSAPEPIAV
ncbi:SNF7 family protein [Babesia caballi]|uniref:SNF7 family protein n=1 Tax=Babesia caballi TaxID=5871 RepID=A0AAV4LNM1_BABCB|nr:SNF7 family protein [Babesia caballi]